MTVRVSVSRLTSVAHHPSPRSTTVRQQPLTAIEAPIAASSSTVVAAITRRAVASGPSPIGETSRTVPSSSTMPVNTPGAYRL